MNITRRAGYPPPVQQQPGAAQLPPPGPGADTRAAVSPRMMGKMNNIADYVLGSTSPKQPLSVTGIENSMGRMNIGQFVQEDVNKNKADINTQAYSETPAVSDPLTFTFTTLFYDSCLRLRRMEMFLQLPMTTK